MAAPAPSSRWNISLSATSDNRIQPTSRPPAPSGSTIGSSSWGIFIALAGDSGSRAASARAGPIGARTAPGAGSANGSPFTMRRKLSALETAQARMALRVPSGAIQGWRAPVSMIPGADHPGAGAPREVRCWTQTPYEPGRLSCHAMIAPPAPSGTSIGSVWSPSPDATGRPSDVHAGDSPAAAVESIEAASNGSATISARRSSLRTALKGGLRGMVLLGPDSGHWFLRPSTAAGRQPELGLLGPIEADSIHDIS